MNIAIFRINLYVLDKTNIVSWLDDYIYFYLKSAYPDIFTGWVKRCCDYGMVEKLGIYLYIG